MQNREFKSILVSLAGTLCLAAAAYAASSGSASGTSATGTSAGAATATPAPAAGGSATQPGTAVGTPGMATAPMTTDTAAAADYPDNEIVALVLTIDDNEIKAAEAAGKKKMGKDAAGFAKMLLKQHRADSNKVSKLARKLKLEPAATSAKVEELRTKGAADLQALSAKDSLEFEQGYVAAMVQGHTEALALLDDHLIKNVDNAKLKSQLQDTRKHVAAHLEHAKRLQGARAER